jgi:hypothetical protein
VPEIAEDRLSKMTRNKDVKSIVFCLISNSVLSLQACGLSKNCNIFWEILLSHLSTGVNYVSQVFVSRKS